jgi:hypothetical protein
VTVLPRTSRLRWIRAGLLALDALQDALHDGRIGDDGDDPHLAAALFAEEWIDLEDMADRARPGSTALALLLGMIFGRIRILCG